MQYVPFLQTKKWIMLCDCYISEHQYAVVKSVIIKFTKFSVLILNTLPHSSSLEAPLKHKPFKCRNNNRASDQNYLNITKCPSRKLENHSSLRIINPQYFLILGKHNSNATVAGFNFKGSGKMLLY